MRAFDTWTSYLDNDRNLLHGKIRFCRKGTTDNVTIYNSDGIAIRNPEFTDLLGRTEYQVFVDTDTNVTAYFYKYVGTGDMMVWPSEDYDPSRWAYQYSSDNMDPTSAIDITSDTANGVATMTDLRAVDPDEVPSVNGAKLMWLYGYYNAGDTSPVLYIWDSASLDSDDGGATIMSNHAPGRGRWKLATRELHFDVRHYGIFPIDDKYSTDYSYTSQLANCAAYVDKEGLDAWFPSLNNDMSYYLYDGTNTFAIKGDIYISDAVRFQVKSDTTGTMITCHELHKRTPYLFDSSVQNGHASLTADWVNISWVGGNCEGLARIGWVIDSSSFARIIKDKEVKFITNGSTSLQLDNCVITSNKQITGEITISNSIIKTEYFADDYDWSNLRSYDNDIRLVNCKDANTYILLKNKQHDGSYGDLNEQTVSDTTLLAGCIAENAALQNVTIQGACELHNVSGSVTVSGSSLALNAVDCWIFVNNSCTVDSMAIRRGSLAGANIQVLTTLYLDNVDINAELTTLGATATIVNSTINADVYSTDIKLERDTINAGVHQRNVGNEVHPDVSYCRFYGPNGKHYLAATTANTKVNGKWLHNDANGGSSYNPISIDLTNIYDSDSSHTYVYEHNTGKFLPRMPKICFTQSKFWCVDEVIRNLIGLPAFTLVDSTLIIPTLAAPVFTGVQVSSGWSTACHFFSVGRAYATFRLTVSFYFTNTTEMNDSMTPRVGEHYVSYSAEKFVTVGDPLTYDFTEFAGEKLGEYMLGPKNYSYPAKITTRDPDTWPETNSAVITVERVR